jgi:micrococcal nuclease
MFKYHATVVRVVDGDTIDALVDLGFSTFKKVRIRMMGINAPESRTRDLEEKAKGLEAKKRLEELLDSGKFILESFGVGKFGRCLGILWVDEVNVNKTLVNEGYANEYYGGKR